MIDALRLSFAVACSVEHAFATWTARTSMWWPSDHTMSGDPAVEVHLEPRAGGRIFERTATGREIVWGEVVTWEPPARLMYLWHFNAARVDATNVEVTFTALDEGTTRVEIVHRGWERLGAAGSGRRDANRAGWQSLLPAYVAACQDGAARA